MYIYLITNLLNGKQYVGQTRQNPEKRFKSHCWQSTVSHPKAKHMPIVKAIHKYGSRNFSFEVIDQASSQSELNDKETYFATKLQTFAPNGYNLKAGSGPNAISEETRKKLSQALKGRKASAETRKRLSESHKGIKQSEETKRKLSRHFKGKRGTDYCYQRAREKWQKTYTIYSPIGDEILVTNLKLFCRNNYLNYCKMNSVVNGKALHYKGWSTNPNFWLQVERYQNRVNSTRYAYFKKTAK